MHFLFTWNARLDRNMSYEAGNCWTSQTARSLLSDVWDFTKCIIFACFQGCHRSKWHVFENVGLPWCFLAQTGCTFTWKVGYLEPKLGWTCTFQSWSDWVERQPPSPTWTILSIFSKRAPLMEKYIREAEVKRTSFSPAILFGLICSELIFAESGNLCSFSLDR